MSQIFEAMAAIMADLDAIGKDKRNNQQGFNYRGIDDVYNALHPIMAKHKVFSTPEVLDVSREERASKSGGVLAFVSVKMKYTFWAHDGSFVSCSVIGEGMDSGDKATNKAMSVAHKYAMFQTFCIPTEDMPDPDAESHAVAPKGKQPEQSQAQSQRPQMTAEQHAEIVAEASRLGLDANALLAGTRTVIGDQTLERVDQLFADEAAKVIKAMKARQ